MRQDHISEGEKADLGAGNHSRTGTVYPDAPPGVDGCETDCRRRGFRPRWVSARRAGRRVRARAAVGRRARPIGSRSPDVSSAGCCAGGDEELLQAWIVLGIDGQPEPGVLPLGPHSDLQAIGEVADEPQGCGAVTAVGDFHRAPGLRAGGVAAPHAVHRPLARVHTRSSSARVCSPRSSSTARNTAVTAASSTSLMVTANAVRISRTPAARFGPVRIGVVIRAGLRGITCFGGCVRVRGC